MDEKQTGFLGKIRVRREENKKAEGDGNRFVDQLMGNIIVNMTKVLPLMSSEAKDESMRAFYGTDAKIQPTSDKVWEAVDSTMDRLKIVNPQLADMIETYDADNSGDRQVAYFFTMMLGAMTNEAASKSEA